MKQGTTPTITVRNTPTGWVADFAGHPDAAEALRLFGTTEFPLALAPLASFETVVKALVEGRPGSRVKLDSFDA